MRELTPERAAKRTFRDACDGRLSRKVLDDAFAAVHKQGVTPRHDCHLDGHVLHWNPLGFARCIYCPASEIDTDRPK